MPGLRDPRLKAKACWAKFRLGTKLNMGLGAAAMDSYMQRETLKLEDLKRLGTVLC